MALTARLVAFVVALVVAIAVVGFLSATSSAAGPPRLTSSFYLRGSKRFGVEFRAVPDGRGGAAKVTAEATKERYKDELLSVAYSGRGKLLPGGGFEAKLPGLGRVAVKFHQRHVHRVDFTDNEGCVERITTIRDGTFVGTAAFHGPGGFTSAKASRAVGQIRETRNRRCEEKVKPTPSPSGEGAPPAEVPPQLRSASIYASGQSGGGAVTFETSGPRELLPGIGSGLPTVDFEATDLTHFRGMRVFARDYVDSAHSEYLSVPTPAGTLTEATTTPPPPFSGAGLFRLEPSGAPSWTGDLAADFPGVGKVRLAGSGFTARLCEDLRCVGE
jgi:hypothetical protein